MASSDNRLIGVWLWLEVVSLVGLSEIFSHFDDKWKEAPPLVYGSWDVVFLQDVQGKVPDSLSPEPFHDLICEFGADSFTSKFFPHKEVADISKRTDSRCQRISLDKDQGVAYWLPIHLC